MWIPITEVRYLELQTADYKIVSSSLERNWSSCSKIKDIILNKKKVDISEEEKLMIGNALKYAFMIKYNK